MIFESIEHANHYAAGNGLEIVIYEDKVVDVTDFKNKHPGGSEVIHKHISKDMTEAYDKVGSHQTKTAMKDLEEFTIGTIMLNEKTKKPNNCVEDYQDKYHIDLKKGILWQVWNKLNKEEYLKFTHDPKHMVNPSEAILFETPLLEFFTKTSWYVIPLLWGPISIYFFHYSYMTMDLSLPALFLWFLFGILVWTIAEYFLHRFVFHFDERIPDTRIAMMLHFLLHGIHHAFPMDKNRLVFPPVAAYPLYRLIKFVVWAVFGSYYTIVVAGVLAGYIGYDLTHYFIHHTKPTNTYFKTLKHKHVLHHYKNYKLGFGISNYFWDYVFNTVIS